MYPFLRSIKELLVYRKAPALDPLETHVSQHICWPWDIDFWMELNNGRTLTLYDLGRITLGMRTGLVGTLKQKRWGLTVAGSSVRYRQRVRMFQRFEMRTRLCGWDDKFMYLEQSMWRNGTCTSHVLIRAAITDAKGLVRMDRVVEALGVQQVAPELPEWIAAWASADALRPWPPMQDTFEKEANTLAA